ncbi:OLC1v1005622C1 [Oldenlandia corymbosa var. corymbosa]|uniref:OLC1v1005622C1 n=1 Tax=Oldenlandia corymbosa var. corymbosa TaxID=529605 RepID=A0AAV1DH20_OLDCO|nr:OLC1v1005622C1 [Oldenlandia corymbosa var. corymbosa]
MSLPQSSATTHSAGQSSIPIQTFASGGSFLPMNMLPNISAVDSYSTVTTDQPTGIQQQSSQQQSNVGSGLFGERSSYLGSYRSQGLQTPAFQSLLFQAPWPVTPGMQQVGNATNNTVARNAQEANQFQLQNAAFPQQVLPMQHRQGSAVVLSQLSGPEGVPRLTSRIGNQNLGNRHNPRHQRLWSQGGGRHQVDLGNEVRQEPDVAANDNQQ